VRVKDRSFAFPVFGWTRGQLAIDTLERISPGHLAFMRQFHFHALMAVPVMARDRPIGTLTFCLADRQRHYTSADRQLAEEMARRAALAIENARLYAATQRARTEAERRLAELTAVIDSMPDAVYIGTASGMTMCNAAALDMLGFDSLADLNHDVAFLAEQVQTRDANTGQRIPPTHEAFNIALGGEPHVSEVMLRNRKTGEDRIVRSTAAL
jgi:PAS domain-containing protein